MIRLSRNRKLLLATIILLQLLLWGIHDKFPIAMDTDDILCRFGIISDIQYANIPDHFNYDHTRKRYYRNGLVQLKLAVEYWKNKDVNFVMDLGDLLDGHSKRSNQTNEDLKSVLDIYDTIEKPVYLHWGNHILYNLNRYQLLQSKYFNPRSYTNVNIYNDDTLAAFEFSPCAGLRVVVLDMYDLSVLGYDEDQPKYKAAERIIRVHNNNEDMNSPIGLVGDNVRFLAYNGGVEAQQLEWLDRVLTKADENNENVLVTGKLQ
jgi:manganese-dependent ADP-ribose/CDP-alcohol diphosphatase